MIDNFDISKAMTIKLDDVLPEYPVFKEGVRRAPKRELTLNEREIKLALKNALRYVPENLHEVLAPEYMDTDSCPRREFMENPLMNTKETA
jgi:urocanate hydratase